MSYGDTIHCKIQIQAFLLCIMTSCIKRSKSRFCKHQPHFELWCQVVKCNVCIHLRNLFLTKDNHVWRHIKNKNRQGNNLFSNYQRYKKLDFKFFLVLISIIAEMWVSLRHLIHSIATNIIICFRRRLFKKCQRTLIKLFLLE